MKLSRIVWLFGLITLIGCTPIYKKMNVDKQLYEGLSEGLYAHMQTSKGALIVELEVEKSPVTVANFVGLAEGKIENSAKKKGEPFYDGTIFHRVIEDFMIQGGDPQGTGMGGPGYKFDDEKNDLKHEGKGILSMANSGPNTNGSQFFITQIPTPWLDGKHTVFGKVVQGIELIDEIAAVDKGAQDRPKEDIVLEKVTIFAKGDAYEKFDGEKVFTEGKGKIQESNKSFEEKQKAEAEKALEELKSSMEVTESGLHYKITEKGNGPKAVKGDTVAVHYAGRLTSGIEFDNSFKRGEPIEFPVGNGMVISGWDEGILLLNEGDKATFLIPPQLGYGARGAGGVIPPNAWLLFDVELVKAKK